MYLKSKKCVLMKWEMTLTMTPKKQLFGLFASDEHKPVIPILP